MHHFAPPVLPSLTNHLAHELESDEALCGKLALLNASEQGIFLIGLDGRLTWMNAEAMRLTEVLDPALVIGWDWLTFWPREERGAVLSALNLARAGIPATFSATCPTVARSKTCWEVIVSPDGPLVAGKPTMTAFIRDVTERKLAVEKLEWAATHDGLTGVANRALLYDRLNERIERAQGEEGSFGLVAFDLDGFKQINERIGHAGGDALLRGFAARLAEIVPAGGLAARFGGDEFVALIDLSAGAADVRSIVEGMLERLRRPYDYAGRSIECTASAGIAIFSGGGRTADDLYMNADIALMTGKAQEPGRAVLFSGDMRQALQRRASSLEIAATAIANGWIEPHYQPKFDLATGKLCGLEALLRWRQPGGRWQSPETIAAAFDDKCLATKITEIIFGKVVSDLSRWQHGSGAVPVAFNAAAADFQIEDFAERLLTRLEQSGVPPSFIELEVTEGVFLGNGAPHVARVLRKLSNAGVRIALDDFGTGYASLSHLKQFPVHVIKIDRSFVSSVAVSHEDRAIVRTMIDLGKSMSIEVVAEGIEDEEQLAFLQQAGCNVGQGFHFGKAAPAAEIEAHFLYVSTASKSLVPVIASEAQPSGSAHGKRRSPEFGGS
jgi:diguanylate cyclase (GGDEF)-like protein